MSERCCKTCRYWDMHSVDMKKGDCRAPDNHRYSRATLPGKKGKRIVALLDSFGPEETLPGFVCGVWAKGESDLSVDRSNGRV